MATFASAQLTAGNVVRYTEEKYPLLRKYTVGAHPLAKEAGMRQMKPLTMTEKGLTDTLIRQMTVDGDESLGTLSPHIVQKWRQKSTLEALPDNVQHWWVNEFTRWLRGVSVFNDQQVTPWGNHNLFHVPGVVDYLKELVRMRADYQFRLIALTVLTPKTLDDCFLFYKYIVTGHGLCKRDYGDGTGGFYRAGDGGEDDTESLAYMTVGGMLDFLDDYSLTSFYERDLALQQQPQRPLAAEDTDALRQTSSREPPHVTMPDATPQTATQSNAPDAPRGPEADSARDRQRRQQERDEERRAARRRQEKEKARADYLAATREATEARSRLDAEMLGAMRGLSQTLQQQQQQLAEARAHDMDRLRRDRADEMGKAASMVDSARIEREFQERERRLVASFDERLRQAEAVSARERQLTEAAHQRRLGELQKTVHKTSREASRKIAELELAHQTERRRHAQESGELTAHIQELTRQLQTAGASNAQIEQAAAALQHQQAMIEQLEQRASAAEARQGQMQEAHAAELKRVRAEMHKQAGETLRDRKFAEKMSAEERQALVNRLGQLQDEHQRALSELRASAASKEEVAMQALQTQQAYQERLDAIGMEVTGMQQQYEQRVAELSAAHEQQTHVNAQQKEVIEGLKADAQQLRDLLVVQQQTFAAELEAHQVNATIENARLRTELEGRLNAYDHMDTDQHPGAATQLALAAAQSGTANDNNQLALIRETALGMLQADYTKLADVTVNKAPLATRANVYSALGVHFFNPALDDETRVQILTTMKDAFPQAFPWVNEEYFNDEMTNVLTLTMEGEIDRARGDLATVIADAYLGQYMGERKAVGGPTYAAITNGEDSSSYMTFLHGLLSDPGAGPAMLEAPAAPRQLADMGPLSDELHDVDESIGGARVMLLEFSEAPAESATQLALRNWSGKMAPVNNTNPFRAAVLNELQAVRESGRQVGQLQLAARTSLSIEPYIEATLPQIEAAIRANETIKNTAERLQLANMRDMLRFQQAQQNVQGRLLLEAGSGDVSHDVTAIAQQRAEERFEQAQYFAERVRLIDFAMTRQSAQEALEDGSVMNHPAAQQMLDLIQTLARGSFQEAYNAYNLFEQRVLNSNQALAIGAS